MTGQWAACMQGSANDGIDPEISTRTIDQDVATTDINMYMRVKNINQKGSPFLLLCGDLLTERNTPSGFVESLARRYFSSPHLRESSRWRNVALPDVGV